MHAVDAMPAEYRDLVNEFGYIDVYRAWRKGLRPQEVKANAARNNGLFVL
jgi:hypothetical protein